MIPLRVLQYTTQTIVSSVPVSGRRVVPATCFLHASSLQALTNSLLASSKTSFPKSWGKNDRDVWDFEKEFHSGDP